MKKFVREFPTKSSSTVLVLKNIRNPDRKFPFFNEFNAKTIFVEKIDSIEASIKIQQKIKLKNNFYLDSAVSLTEFGEYHSK